MHAPTQAQLLDLWDAGSRATPSGRAALLLQSAWADATVAQWPLGVANARLLELRAALFGPTWDCVADCPACAQVAEVRLDVAAMLTAAPGTDPAQTPAWHTIDESPATPRFRLPVLADLTSAAPADASSAARLLQAIVTAPALQSNDAALVDLPPHTRTAIEQELLRLDPLAAIDIVMDCPACGHRWRAAADIIGMLWADLSTLAQRLLGDVARLASVFGWSEQQILALSPVRRQHYLDMVREW
ncbi:hypothetical protein [Rhizobacter sp. Root1221]|uniref:hypothetical protein n=1 Tax=Rhizobacter sp. Root1221 TaxID=1736433 RepID=UPI0006FCB886|nr:hypothetical protein [Rhizobacter sp. Root1221]KQW02327.1 hypothetical protein ASC87_13995 [Rhizobacter sp. Root1221]